MSELSLRETAARALALQQTGAWRMASEHVRDEYRDDASAVLAAVADHNGLADVLRTVLTAHGVDDVGGIHHWRCQHPDVYRPCACFDELLANLADVVRAWLKDAGDAQATTLVQPRTSTPPCEGSA